MDIDVNSLTLDELDELAEAMPEAVEKLMSGTPSPKAMKGIAWIVKRRNDPDFTLEDAGKLTLAAFSSDDPKVGNGPTT